MPRSPYSLEFANRQRGVKVSLAALKKAATTVLTDERVATAEVSIALVADDEMQSLNRDYLGHDYPTDVVSFLLESESSWTGPARKPRRRGDGLRLEGEIILGAEYARAEAEQLGWDVEAELCLYLVHGLLHLCGYDDLTPGEKRIMRRREREVFALLGREARYRRTRT
jgi:probable rRNA maturation factor